MIRSELIASLAEKHPQFTTSDVQLAVKTIIDSINNQLGKGSRVEIRGLCTFSVRIRPARQGRNPRTGEKVHVPERATLYFRPGTELRERLNKESA